MRLHTAALAAAALVARAVYADESATPSAPIARPNFTPSTITAEFVEQFTDDWASRWKPSHAKKDMAGSSQDPATEEWAYVGEWSVEEPVVLPGILGDKGLVVKNAAAHHAISAKFPNKIDPTGKTLVVQYEVKLQDGLSCGGAYLKLLRENKALHQEEFANTTPYVIMFGPDKCGHTNKVHFIFNHKNPVTGEYEEKHLSSPPTARDVKTTELYTLIIKPDNSFVIKQNGEEVKSGSLLEDFAPPVMPPAEIDDPSDAKPADWVEEARIADPAAAKPADWDEAAPYEVVDEDATVPDDWLEAEPLSVPDPDAAKPEDWDDDEDGDWIPPTVPNPACADVSGCGPWTKPMKKNPAYKGKWSAPFIDNPAYKGKWAPRKIANPDYFEDKTPANLEPMGAIGFEIWTMQKDILFDNIYIGHSVEDADAFARETFYIKQPIEKAEQDANKPKDKPKSESGLKFTDDPVRFMQQKLELFLAVAQQDPIQAFSMVPEAGAALVSLAAVALAIIYSLVSALGAPSVEDVKKAAGQAKDKVVELKDNVAEAAATGAETAKAEVAKRTGKGQQPQQPQQS